MTVDPGEERQSPKHRDTHRVNDNKDQLRKLSEFGGFFNIVREQLLGMQSEFVPLNVFVTDGGLAAGHIRVAGSLAERLKWLLGSSHRTSSKLFNYSLKVTETRRHKERLEEERNAMQESIFYLK